VLGLGKVSILALSAVLLKLCCAAFIMLNSRALVGQRVLTAVHHIMLLVNFSGPGRHMERFYLIVLSCTMLKKTI